MSKYNDLEVYDGKTGVRLPIEVIESIKKEEYTKYHQSLFWKYKNNKKELTLNEVEDLRFIIKKKELSRSRNKKSVYLKYTDGFYMVANNTEDNLKQLSFEANGLLHLLGFNINKSGVVIYKNNKPIKCFNKLREFVSMSERVWRRVKKEIDAYDLIRKEKVNGELLLIINPKFMGTSYEVTEYKFMVWHKYFKECLDDIDYLYLVKKFGLDLSIE